MNEGRDLNPQTGSLLRWGSNEAGRRPRPADGTAHPHGENSASGSAGKASAHAVQLRSTGVVSVRRKSLVVSDGPAQEFDDELDRDGWQMESTGKAPDYFGSWPGVSAGVSPPAKVSLSVRDPRMALSSTPAPWA
jgi:hypothetical protein